MLLKETKAKNGKKAGKREYDFLEGFDEKVKLDRKSIKLWGKLSKDWVHTKGIVDRIVGQISEKSTPPPWALVIPMNYAMADLDAINELGKCVSQFREILKVTRENYKQEFSSEKRSGQTLNFSAMPNVALKFSPSGNITVDKRLRCAPPELPSATSFIRRTLHAIAVRLRIRSWKNEGCGKLH